MNLRLCLSITAAAVTLIPMTSLADESTKVTAASLQVKERLKSIEQINVTAPTDQKEVEPVSQAVADLLKEADTLDKASGVATEEAQN